MLILPSMLRSLMFSMPATMRQHLYSYRLRPHSVSTVSLCLPRNLSHYTAPQSATSARYLPPSHFADFDKIRVGLSGAPITEWELLQEHYRLPPEHVQTFQEAYQDWCEKMQSLPQYPKDVGLLLHCDLRDPKTLQMLREAYKQGEHSCLQFGRYDHRVWWTANLWVTIPGTTPYFTPPTLSFRKFSSDRYSPFLWCNIELADPRARLPAEAPAWRPLVDIATFTSGFTTKVVHLGMIRFYLGPCLELSMTPYCAVAKLSETNDGTTDGIFAFPIDYHRRDSWLRRTWSEHLNIWEPRIRGVYYLGRDFYDVLKRKQWELCSRLGGRNVEVVRSVERPNEH